MKIDIDKIKKLQHGHYLEIKDKLSSSALSIYEDTRALVPTFADDSIKYKDVENVKNYLINTSVKNIF